MAEQTNQQQIPSIEFIRVNSHLVDESSKYQRSEYLATYKIIHNIKSVIQLHEAYNELTSAFVKAVNPYMKEAGDDDIFTFFLIHPAFSTPCWVAPQKKGQFKENCFINALSKISQSNTKFLFNGFLQIQINIVKTKNDKPLTASGNHKRKSQTPQTYSQHLQNKNSRYYVDHSVGCGYISLAIAKRRDEMKADSQNNHEVEWKRIRRTDRESSHRLRVEMGKQIAELLGKNFEEPISSEYLEDFKEKTGYAVVLIHSRSKKRIFNTTFNGPEKVLYLEFEESESGPGHLNVITSIKGYLDKPYYCCYCDACFYHPFEHLCNNTCNYCRHQPKCREEETRNCFNCKVTFLSRKCYENHLQKSNDISVCTRFSKCERCGIIDGRGHVCEAQNRRRKCPRCKEVIHHYPHFCSIPTLDSDKLKEEDDRNKIIVCFDIESAFTEENLGKLRHSANLLICRTCCDNCYNYQTNEKEENCDICGELEHVFLGPSSVKDFGNYLYNYLSPRADQHHLKIIVLAHNASGYDNKFIIRDLFNRDFKDIDLIMNGLKVLKAEVGNIRFIDSLSIFQQGLASLPKAFGLPDIGKKRFPYLFNVAENWDYDGTLPALEFWDPNNMKPGPREDFLMWYEEHKNDHFNLKQELVTYCQSDVEILLKAVQVFRKTFKSLTDIDPITRKFTLAGIGLEYFRAKVLQEKQIGITPVNGYASDRKRSIRAIIWIEWIEKERDINIIREKKIVPYYVDGFCEESNTIYEYYGCKWHGHDCLRGYPNNRDSYQRNPKGEDVIPDELFQRTLKREKDLKDMGFRIECTWECVQEDFRRMDGTYTNFYKDRYKINKYLKENGGVNIRDSFFGGRTENFKFVMDVSDDPASKLLYYDFRSLYPYVLKYFDYPLGHPIIISHSFKDLKEYFGFIKCKILAPTKMYVPILPVRRDNKLMFPLCNSCSIEKVPECKHGIDERALIGTWTTIEVQNAIENGYSIKEIYEIYHYPRRSKELFKNYIDKFLKIKQESDGYPSWVQTNEDKEKYIDDFKVNNNIDLEADKIEKNPALRFIAKLFLNTLWGKLAQRSNMPKTEVISDYDRYIKLITDTTKIITGELKPNDKYIVVNYKEKDEVKAYQANTSIAVASFVTSYARTVLWRKMNEIKPEDLLYCDTDSIIFRWKPGQPRPETGDNLGELCDEIEKDYGTGARCTKFVSLGPKVYGLEIEKADKSVTTSLKCKGISLTHNALDVVNLNTMIELATSYINKENKSLEVEQLQIKSDKHHTLYSNYVNKKIQTVFEKRYLLSNQINPLYNIACETLVAIPVGYYKYNSC